jgi:flagellar basal-body rod protein FlgC
MVFKRIIKAMFLFFICFLTLSCNKNMHIVIVNEEQKELINNYLIYRKFNIKYIDNGNYLTLKNVNENILIGIISMLNLKIDLIKDNIANRYTTRTTEGGPYLRKYLKITIENGMEILQEASAIRLKYDPAHPDAIRDGEKEGYIQYPEIDLITEYYNLIETVQLYNAIVEYINNNYKQIAIVKVNMMTIDEKLLINP